jgi:ribonuclease VapC
VVIDSSALIAILLGEKEAELFAEHINGDRYRLVSTVSFLETSIVITSRVGPSGFEDLDALIAESGLRLIPYSQAQAYVARQAYINYGKGRHPAKLNFGDCCSYALAKVFE